MPYAVRTYAGSYNIVYGTTCVSIHIWGGIGGPGLDVSSDLKRFLPSTAYILISPPHTTPQFPKCPLCIFIIEFKISFLTKFLHRQSIYYGLPRNIHPIRTRRIRNFT